MSKKRDLKKSKTDELRYALKFYCPPFAPEWYPCERPDTHYVITPEKMVLPVEIKNSIRNIDGYTSVWEGKNTKLNDLLEEWGEALLEDRVPIAAYGANRSPLRMVGKMEDSDKSVVIPTIRGVVKGGVVLFNSYIWINGHIASQINPASGLNPKLKKEPITECWINLITFEQFSALNKAQKTYAPRDGYYVGVLPWTFKNDTIDIYTYSSYLPCLAADGKYLMPASGRYIGKGDGERELLPNRDFAPIETHDIEDLSEVVTEKSEIEAMKYVASLVKEEFGIELYHEMDKTHSYRLTEKARKKIAEINNYFKSIGKSPKKKYPPVKTIKKVKTLEQLIK